MCACPPPLQQLLGPSSVGLLFSFFFSYWVFIYLILLMIVDSNLREHTIVSFTASFVWLAGTLGIVLLWFTAFSRTRRAI